MRAQVPVVAVTAQAFVEQVEDCRRAGMIGHLAKPFTLDSLLAKVASSVNAPAQWPQPPEAGPAPSNPEGLQVLDQAAFTVTASLLPPAALASFLRKIAHRANDFLHAARQPAALAGRPAELADMAHALAGSAGMFGFQRLADTAKRFERAIGAGSSEASLIIAEMSLAADDVLAEIRLRCEAKAPTEPAG
jgi:HPt (histidine-containing phosphotransfer) domain-containing protein